MNKVAIITDSDLSLPAEVAARYLITQVPIMVQFGEESFASGVEIDERSLFERIDREGTLPTTAAPSPGAFVDAFRKAFDAGAESIICITISSVMSGVFNSAIMACDNFPGKQITVVDSQTLSLGQGFMVLAAAEAVDNGATHAQALALIELMIPRTQLYGALPTLKYLAMSGRVGKLAAGMANILNINPILTSRNGKLELLEKVRTHRVAIQRVVDLCVRAVGEKEIEKIGFIHSNNPEGAEDLKMRLKEVLKIPADPIIAEFTVGLSVHTGSGMVGVAFTTKD